MLKVNQNFTKTAIRKVNNRLVEAENFILHVYFWWFVLSSGDNEGTSRSL